MRIIAGEKRGVRLRTLKGEATRPTLERVKEGMFSAVHFILPGARVLDLYAGSGQLGLEALSRGAAFCTFVDADKQAADTIRQNAEAAGLTQKCSVRKQDAAAFLALTPERYDVIFVDPPYQSGALPGLLEQLDRVCENQGVVLCESAPDPGFPQRVGALLLQKQYRYGRVWVSRYTAEKE